MPLEFVYESGASKYADPGETISNLSFGARYVSYDSLDRFLDQTNALNIGMIVWPGGTLAEMRDDRYSLKFDDLYNSSTGKPGISEMMAVAVSKDAGLSVVLPTARYVGDPEGLVADLRNFLGKLLDGSFGQVPDTMILEIGSEYYSNFEGPDRASDYGVIADLMVREIAAALSDPSVNLIDANLLVAVQLGKTLSDDIAIRDELSNPALSNIDMLIHHLFAYQPQGIDPRLPELQQIVESWAADVIGAGGSDPGLFVSAWNTVTLTRNDALADYVEDAKADGFSIDPASIDLGGRTNTDFEQFWQDRLSDASYGQEHAAYILESFSSFVEAGMDAGSVYGVDTLNPGHLSWRDGGQDYAFVGAQMIQMIYESVGDTHVLATRDNYSQNDLLTIYGFENDDKLIVFISAGDTAPGDILLDLEGLGTDYLNVWAERLTSETPDDWMSVFGVADNPEVDESPEAQAYAVGVREAFLPDISGSGLGLTLEDAHDVIRLSFAKSAAGFAEISEWAIGDPTTLSIFPELPVAESGPIALLPEEAEELNLGEVIADAAGSGALGMVLALLFFFV